MEPVSPSSVSQDPNLFKNYFDDLSARQESDLLASKIQVTRSDLSPPVFQNSSFSTRQLDTSPDQLVKTEASAILNQQFFVWRNGEAGRLSVDTPFGFKAL